MRNGFWGLNGVMMGAFSALLSGALVLGGFILAFSENQPAYISPPSSTALVISQLTPLPPVVASPTSIPPSVTPLPTQTATASASPSPSVTLCSPPDGWVPITVERKDNLKDLAALYGTTAEALIDANCLTVSQLTPGSTLYVPSSASPPPLPTQVVCTYPPGWIAYQVRPGDTLYSLAARFGFSPGYLQSVNCLPSDRLYAGQVIYLPYYPWPPVIPTTPPPWPTTYPTDTVIPTDTEVPTQPPPTEPPTEPPPTQSPIPTGPISSSPSPPPVENTPAP